MRLERGQKGVSTDCIYFLKKKILRRIWQNVKICLNWMMADREHTFTFVLSQTPPKLFKNVFLRHKFLKRMGKEVRQQKQTLALESRWDLISKG